MLQALAEMSVSHDLCHKELDISDDLGKSTPWKGGRGRTWSDELSTAVPSPEASPTFGPQQNTPLCGPEELLLPDLSNFELPEAQDSSYNSDAEFELAGFDEEECKQVEFEIQGVDEYKIHTQLTISTEDKDSAQSSDDEDSSEDIESEILEALSQLSSLRADSRQLLQVQDASDSGLQKIPYPQLESGFIPSNFMPMQSWLMPAGCAKTGQFAHLMAPRPSNGGMEPLNIILGEAGVTLEVAPGWPEECWSEIERKFASKAKAVFRRRRGRSRSPDISMEEIEERGVRDGSPRGRPRFWTR